MPYRRNLQETYSPLYFLAALGAGGAAISFFMYLMFMVPHKNYPMPTFAHWMDALQSPGIAYKIMIPLALLAIILLAGLHVSLLIWNIREYQTFKRTPAFQKLQNSNNGVQLMALPLTFAMSVNVGFILGALFVPGLWSVVEYLFPLAIIAFLVIGYYAMRIFSQFMTNVLVNGHFDCEKNNSLAQMLSVFALSMVGVGLSAPAAMSHVKLTATIGFIGSVFFITAAIIFGTIKLILGFRSMMNNGVQPETTPTLWILIPVLTVIGIALFRLVMALAHNFDSPTSDGGIFTLLTTLLAIEALFGLIGYAIMKRVGYFERYVKGSETSPGSFALVCPGIAAIVMANFFINHGLVRIGVLDKFSLGYFALYLPIIWLQIITLRVMWRLITKMIQDKGTTSGVSGAATGPAE